MNKFIQQSLFFALLSLSILIVLISGTSFLCQFIFDFDIPKNKNVLVVGDSHPQCAIDDSIVPNTFNVSQGGTGYFYSYLKIREAFNRNPHIDTVVLGYSYYDLAKGRDKWFSGDEKIKFFMRNHFFLFTMDDYFELLEANPLATIRHTPQVIIYSSGIAFCGYPCIGKYKRLKKSKLEEAKGKFDEIKQSQQDSSELSYSIYQQKNLLKIYEFCESNKIKLILLNTPIHPHLGNHIKNKRTNYFNFVESKTPNAKVVDHSSFKIPEEGFSDLRHLNYNGAKIYSEFLKRNRFLDINP